MRVNMKLSHSCLVGFTDKLNKGAFYYNMLIQNHENDAHKLQHNRDSVFTAVSGGSQPLESKGKINIVILFIHAA